MSTREPGLPFSHAKPKLCPPPLSFHTIERILVLGTKILFLDLKFSFHCLYPNETLEISASLAVMWTLRSLLFILKEQRTFHFPGIKEHPNSLNIIFTVRETLVSFPVISDMIPERDILSFFSPYGHKHSAF